MDEATDTYLRALDKIVVLAAIASLVMLVIILRQIENEPDEDDE